MMQFPCAELENTYHFMRASESLTEAADFLSTNPLFVINPTIVRYAIAASSTDSSTLIGRGLKIGRDRLVPEFKYLEPRAAGGWDMLELKQTEKAVWAMDVMDDDDDEGPPPNEDGTPHETLADQAVRLRQLMSVLEAQYSGDVVLVIACDGTSLELLSCLLAGIPYNRVHELEFQPVTTESILALWKKRQEHLRNYNAAIEEGKIESKRLREKKTIINLKDRQLKQERQEVERRREAEEREARQLRAKQIEEANGGPIIPPIAVAGVRGRSIGSGGSRGKLTAEEANLVARCTERFTIGVTRYDQRIEADCNS